MDVSNIFFDHVRPTCTMYALHQWFITFYAQRTPKITNDSYGPLNLRTDIKMMLPIYDRLLHFHDLHGAPRSYPRTPRGSMDPQFKNYAPHGTPL